RTRQAECDDEPIADGKREAYLDETGHGDYFGPYGYERPSRTCKLTRALVKAEYPTVLGLGYQSCYFHIVVLKGSRLFSWVKFVIKYHGRFGGVIREGADVPALCPNWFGDSPQEGVSSLPARESCRELGR